MRIIHLISSCSSGGAEVFVKDLCIELQQQGHHCVIAYCSSCKDLGADTVFETRFLAELDTAGVEHFEIGHQSRRNPLRGMLRLRELALSFHPDVLHIHLARALFFRVLLFQRIPTFFTCHSTTLSFDPRLFWLFDRVVDRYVAICSVSERILEPLTRRKICKIYNGVPPNRIGWAGDRAPTGSLNIVSVGNLVAQKNYKLLVEIAASIRDAIPGNCPVFRIAGQGENKTVLDGLIQAYDLDKNVLLLGARSDVGALLAASDVYLLTSSTEGFPIALLEALQSGLPIVASDVGGIAEIVSHGENGLLVTSGDKANFVKSVLRINDDRRLLTSMSAAARKRASDFLIEKSALAHLQMYAELLIDGSDRLPAQRLS